ncbi:MAG TPA: hypothetical protein VN457_03610, partial [Chlamydiales bacterium]|nr:hypothetical protein [Chlamydiales bacterium]
PWRAKNPQAFAPFIAITKNGHVGILYFDLRENDKSNSDKTKVDAWLAIYKEVKNPNGGSTKIGLDFVKEIRLSEKSYIAENGPTTTQGVMVDGDYPFLVAQADRFIAIYTKSLKGPFSRIRTFFRDPAHDAVVLLDRNYRQAPFVSIVESPKKKKPTLLLTRQQKWRKG